VNHSDIFSITTKKDFEKKALEIFQFQAANNLVYKNYIRQLGIAPEKVKEVNQIPFLPIEFFKTQKVVCKSQISNLKSQIFLSSGTTGMERSKHFVSDLSLYEKSFRKCFDIFYGDTKQYSILSFLPSYYENKSSSLLFMMNDLMKSSRKKESRFYKKQEQEKLLITLKNLLSEKKKIILFGVSYALLDLTEKTSLSLRRGMKGEVFIIETGGMKGRREEITREELHKTLSKKFGVKKIHSEYGMTELLSQAYSKGDGIFQCPPWMKVFVRDANDPFSFLPHGQTGALNIIDLANINSCSFIATQDVGRTHKDGSFEVLGRMDNSDLRGCNLLV
jgi:hypothetical protein